MRVNVCVGSSCHLKGSYDVVQKLQKLVKDNNLEEKIEICGSFCLGHCSNGVTIKIGEDYIENINAQNIEEKFKKEIITRL
ncbi:MAG: NAD(P)H-dependent oxidoreductase subunit E [Bacilli bacterium]|nr:NAD(P)H-dependent oxidoreductase subunit E [Bacilli bacterium]